MIVRASEEMTVGLMPQHQKQAEPVLFLDNTCLKTVYTFTYRLSGNQKIAEKLTEKVLLKKPRHHDAVILLKLAWEKFFQYYGSVEFQGKCQTEQALLALSPESRSAVILRDMLGYSYRQIATILDKSETEAGRLIAEGRKAMRKKP
jgi:hypothetical protein